MSQHSNHVPPPRSPRPPAHTPAWLLAASLIALLLVPRAWSDRADDVRVLFVGLDGATWKVIGPMIERGELPTFERLVAEGAYMPRFETINTTHSPLVWTSVVTGRLPRDHGVVDYVQTLDSGKTIPITSNSRTVPAIWEIANRGGLTVGVIGWWASWPAEEIEGYVISDHANPTSTAFEAAQQWIWPVDPDSLKNMRRDFLPLDLDPLLREHWIDRDRFPIEDFQQRARLTDQQVELLLDAPWFERTKYSILKLYYTVDRPYFSIALQLYEERPTDLLLVYLRSPDPIQHYAWDLVEIDAYDRQTQTHLGLTPPEHLERDRGIIEGVYRYLDSFLAELLEAKAPNTTLIVASDHGAEPTPFDDDVRPGAHTTAAKGVLFIHGPHVKANTRLTEGDPLDLMPTFAWLLGLPLADELVGEPLFEAFEDDFVASHEPTRIPSYGAREAGPSLPSAADDAMIEQLRALGYVETGRGDAERSGEEPSAEQYVEMSLVHYRLGDYRKSIDACRSALALRPDYAVAYNNICSCHNQLGEWDKAIEACRRAIELDPDLARARANLQWAIDSKPRE